MQQDDGDDDDESARYRDIDAAKKEYKSIFIWLQTFSLV